MKAWRLSACVVGVLAIPAAGLAQDRVRITINAGQQTSTSTFGQAGRFQEFLEDATFTGDHRIDRDWFYEGGVSVRVASGFTAGVAVSHFSASDAVAVRAGIPHPFFFDRPRQVSDTPGGLIREETGVHILLGWVIPATDRFEIGIAFGPSILQVKQDLVERVGYTHAYPYDEAQSAGVVTGRPTETATGFNAGADLTWKFSRHAGIGGVIRFSRARIETTGGAGDAVSFDAGGLHAGGGLRLIF